MIIAGTGHRPNKLGGYNQKVLDRLTDLAMDSLRSFSPDLVITGMAQGWDTSLAIAAIKLDIQFRAYVPFKGQELMWPSSAQTIYRGLLELANEVVICSEGDFSAGKMQIRNERMVDDSDVVLALWNGTDGGTKNCIRYAKSAHIVPVFNVWPYWIRHYNKCPNQHL